MGHWHYPRCSGLARDLQNKSIREIYRLLSLQFPPYTPTYQTNHLYRIFYLHHVYTNNIRFILLHIHNHVSRECNRKR